MTSKTGTATIRATASAGGSWAPIEGEEARDLLERTLSEDPDGQKRLVEASRAILSRCAEPSGPFCSGAGLAIGYVQSGKTLSFTTVAALARDNGFAMIVLLGGTSKYLLEQTEGRLVDDLALKEKRSWLHVLGPRSGIKPAKRADDVQMMQATLDEWSDPDLEPEDRRTLIVTVMKHAGNLRLLAEMIGSLRFPVAPVLIIDDEADQASLDGNAGSPKKSEVTKTYAAISDLREAISSSGGSHTYLQYTATPQANLLIEIDDALSPSFVQILEPGDAYVGGRELFIEKEASHVRRIPLGEVDEAIEAAGGPPASLRDALATFLVGIAADYQTGLARKPGANRSMLIHPSRLTDDHSQLRRWIEAMKVEWAELLPEDAGLEAPEERDDLFDLLRRAHEDLARTDATLPRLDELVTRMRLALNRTQVLELNRGAPPVPWNKHFAFILIGGQAIERGFTVEGLTVTHLARSTGQKLADSIQQRARFFGYKRGYLGHVRIWVDDETKELFKGYARHEQDLRGRLQPIADAGRPLRHWRREFLLDPRMRPTRRSVLKRVTKQRKLSDEWMTMDRPPVDGPSLNANRAVLSEIKDAFSFDEDTGDHRRTSEQRHLVTPSIPIQALLNVLADVRSDDGDQRASLYGAILQLDAFADQPDRSARIYLMSKGVQRERTFNSGKVAQLFQGRNPRTGTPVYPGDREIMSRKEPSIQIHVLRFKDGSIEQVPTFALWIPECYATGTLVQMDD